MFVLGALCLLILFAGNHLTAEQVIKSTEPARIIEEHDHAAKGYILIEHGPTNREIMVKLRPYSKATRPLLEKYGGNFIVSSSETTEPLEGSWLPPFLAIIEFPTYESARAFYFSDGYQAVLPLRLAALPDSRAILVEGRH